LEVLHFSTAAPLGATRRTFQPPFTYLIYTHSQAGGSGKKGLLTVRQGRLVLGGRNPWGQIGNPLSSDVKTLSLASNSLKRVSISLKSGGKTLED